MDDEIEELKRKAKAYDEILQIFSTSYDYDYVFRQVMYKLFEETEKSKELKKTRGKNGR